MVRTARGSRRLGGLRAALATVVIGASLVTWAALADAHHPTITGSAVCSATPGYVDVSWTSSAWLTSDPNHRVNKSISIRLWDGKSFNEIAHGAYLPSNKFTLIGDITVPNTGDPVRLQAVAEVPWGPNGEYPTDRATDEVAISAPGSCKKLEGPGTSSPTTPGKTCVTSGRVSGTVYVDFNANGNQDTGRADTANDRGLAGVDIVAFDEKGTKVGTAVTNATGAYTINVSGSASNHLRIEVVGLPDGYQNSGGPEGSTIRFADVCTANVDIAVIRPADYCQDNPDLASSCFRQDALGSDPVVQTSKFTAGYVPVDGGIDYSKPTTAWNSGYPDRSGGTTGHPVAVPSSETGSVSSLAWRASSRTLYAAAFVRMNASVGPHGPGAIYAITVPQDGGAAKGARLLIDLGPEAAGNPKLSKNEPVNTSDISRTGLGGMAFVRGEDPSQDALYVVGLADGLVHRITNLDDKPTDERLETPLSLPNDGEGSLRDGHGSQQHQDCGEKDVRPFALTAHDGGLYLGLVCSAASTQNRDALRAYVYRYDLAAGGFDKAPVLEFPLDYLKQATNNFGSGPHPTEQWQPWDDQPWVNPDQAIFSDIAFASDGAMIIGLRSRMGDVLNSTGAASSGDILRAPYNDTTGSWAIESDLSPKAAHEFFFQDQFPFTASSNDHQETFSGGIAAVPGVDQIATGGLADWYSGGVVWPNARTGEVARAMKLFDWREDPNSFGKNNGLGDLEALCNDAPIVIGDRVWADLNNDGVQNPGEPGFPGVEVTLRDADLHVISTTKTDDLGVYTFSGLSPHTTYIVSYTLDQKVLADHKPTTPGRGDRPDLDSDGQDLGRGLWGTKVETGGVGDMNRTVDFGILGAPPPLCDCVLTTTVAPTTTAPPTTTTTTSTSSTSLFLLGA